MLVPAKWAFNPRPRSVCISVNSAPECSHHSGSKMLIPIPIWNRYQTLTQIPWNPFYLLVDVLVPLASAVALAKAHPYNLVQRIALGQWKPPCPKLRYPHPRSGTQGKGINVLLSCFKVGQTLQYNLCSKAWEDLMETTCFPLPVLLPSLPYRCLLRELLQGITCTWNSVFGSVSTELNLKCGLSSQDT